MLPLWVRYYGGQFGTDNLYVVDDNSEDGSTDNLPCDVLHIPPIRDGKFNSTRMAVVGNLGRSLLQLYDVVLFCDTDEFIVPDPDRHAGLKEYVETRSGDGLNAVGSLGFNVVHDVGSEPPLDLDKPLLGQRQLAKFLPLMCKPAIKWVPGPLERRHPRGAHAVRRGPGPVDVPHEVRRPRPPAGGRRPSATDGRGRRPVAGDPVAPGRGHPGRPAGADHRGADAAEIPEFVPPTGAKLDALVVEDPKGNWRAPKGSQMTLMEKRPLVRIPQRFHGTV